MLLSFTAHQDVDSSLPLVLWYLYLLTLVGRRPTRSGHTLVGKNRRYLRWRCSPETNVMRYTPMRCMPVKYTSMRYTHAHEVYAHEVHAREVHAYEVHAHKVYARGVHAREIHAHEVHASEMIVSGLHRHRRYRRFLPTRVWPEQVDTLKDI